MVNPDLKGPVKIIGRNEHMYRYITTNTTLHSHWTFLFLKVLYVEFYLLKAQPRTQLRLFLTIALRILSAHNLWGHLARPRARAY